MVYGGHGVCFGDLTGRASSHSCEYGALGPSEIATIAQYAAKGIPVTITVETWHTGLGGLPRAAAKNVDTLRWYYRDHLKLPVNVAVVVDSVSQLPAPDGRRYPCNSYAEYFCRDTSASAHRYLNSATPVVVLGRDGRLLYAGTFSPLLDALLTRILATPANATLNAGGSSGPH
jgi:hypothetical protein